MEEQLTTRQVAAALSVSESSVKRWCNCGAIPTIRTLGGHRRIPLTGLMEFLEVNNREVKSPLFPGSLAGPAMQLTEETSSEEVSPNLSGPELLAQLVSALEKGDELACRSILTSIYSAQENFAVVADRFVAAAFHEIGERWKYAVVEIYQERRACEICARMLHELRRLIPEAPADAPLALGGSPTGDQYTLPSKLVDLVLRESGWRTMNLGCNLPLTTVAAAVREHRPRLLWLSVSEVESPSEFALQYQELRSQLPRDQLVVVGGRALNDDLRPQLSYTAHCDNMQQLASFASAVHGAS